jgi:putative membrane protein
MKALSIAGFSLLALLAACVHDESALTPAGVSAPGPAIPPVAMGRELSQPSSGPSGASLTAREPVATEGGAAAADRDAGAPLDNDQILQVVRQAHLGQAQQARIAHAKSRDARVQKLAAQILRDGDAAESKGDALAKKAALKPESSPLSESVQNAESGATLALSATRDRDFDRAYVDTQVRQHQALLDALAGELLPSSSNPDLTAYLHAVRAAMATHLDHARALQRDLEK